MKKPAIPSINIPDVQVAAILSPMKTSIEIMTGARGGAIEPLDANATLADVIEKVNLLITRLNA